MQENFCWEFLVNDKLILMIIPCIDLMSGKAVQLIQGEKKALEVEDLNSLIKKFSVFGEIQLIDLDAAKGIGSNEELIKKICKKIRCSVGGGIRSIEKAAKIEKFGAVKIILGSAVFEGDKINIQFLDDISKKIPKQKIMIAIDSKSGRIVTRGWRHDTGIKIESAIKHLEKYCDEFLYTYVDKEGMMQGTNLEIFRILRKLTKNKITAAGGISTIEEIKYLEKIKINSALGMALYTGKLNFDELVKLNAEFTKSK